jgi:probable HAF family extracellular repeat protein
MMTKSIIWFLLPLLLTTADAIASGYRVIDLGEGIIPAAINQQGDVAGTVVTAFSAPVAFLYKDGTLSRLGHLGGTGSWALAINDAAEVAGSICLEQICRQNPHWGIRRHGFILRQGKVTDINPATGMMEVSRINNSGLILGEADPRVLPHACKGKVVLYDYARDVTVASFLTYGDGARYLKGTGLNDRGEVTFVKSDCGSWSCVESYLYSKGDIHPIAGNGWVAWIATAINNNTEIVGSCQYTRGGPLAGVVAISPVHFDPIAINNNGLIIGSIPNATGFPRKGTSKRNWQSAKLGWLRKPSPLSTPALLAGGKITVLQEQLATDYKDWTLEEVIDVNDRGEIIGYGTKKGGPLHGFILEPN